MDRFSELRAFAAVIEAGGFSAAARELNQSRSAVNRLVIALEERLGVQLLHRTTGPYPQQVMGRRSMGAPVNYWTTWTRLKRRSALRVPIR